jgi:splicing suppressor protein 51
VSGDKLPSCPPMDALISLDYQKFYPQKTIVRDKFNGLQRVTNPYFRYQLFCSHCYRRQSQLDSGALLRNCDACKIAGFCSDCPAQHSSDECQAFHELVDDENWTLEHNKRQRDAGQPELTMVCTQSSRDSYLPLSAAGGWYEYYTRISDKDLKGLKVTADLRPGSDQSIELAAAGYLRYGTRATTIPLTILAALEKLFPDLGTRTSISLHLLGANPWELQRLMVFEEILHLLPKLFNLQLTLIGPDIPEQAVSSKVQELGCCQSCTSRFRKRTIFLYRGPYHEFVDTKQYEQPDLAVAFHTGFSQEAREEWIPTIRHIASAKHPTLFTTYNKEEMREEAMIFTRLGAKFVQEGEPNQWKAVCPILEPMGSEENNVYYSNQYCYIVGPGKA